MPRVSLVGALASLAALDERKARVVSAINHLNILTICEVGQDGDLHFIAAEFVEVETLRARCPAPAENFFRHG